MLLDPAVEAELGARLAATLARSPGVPRTHRCTSCKLNLLSFDFRCSMCGAWDAVEPGPAPQRATGA